MRRQAAASVLTVVIGDVVEESDAVEVAGGVYRQPYRLTHRLVKP